jgi:RHS repeat-associated protein
MRGALDMRSAVGCVSLLVGLVFAGVIWTIPNIAFSQSAVAAGVTSVGSAPVVSPGESATLLPDGRWLLVGGRVSGEVQAGISIVGAKGIERFPASLTTARCDQAAIVLPDGTVLVFGGTDAKGEPVASAEIVDPSAGIVRDVKIPGLIARSGETATLMTDGTVLLAGGRDAAGEPIAQAQIWDPRSNLVRTWEPQLLYPRYGGNAYLLADGMVYISGGSSGSSTELLPPEEYDPATRLFQPVAIEPQSRALQRSLAAAPEVAQTVPAADAVDVPVDSTIAVRFSTPMQMEDLNSANVTLVGPAGAVSGKVVGAEGGMLAFFTPTIELLPGTVYTLFVDGMKDSAGGQVPLSAFRFTTHRYTASNSSNTAPTAASNLASAHGAGSESGASGGLALGVISGMTSSSSVAENAAAQQRIQQQAQRNLAADASEDWVPRAANRHGAWRVLGLPGDPPLAASALDVRDLQAPAGTTAISGHVLRLNGTPLSGVQLSMDGRVTVTDSTGRFLLAGVSPGEGQLKVDGTGVLEGGWHYTEHFLAVTARSGTTTPLAASIYLPRVNPAYEVSISSPAAHEIILQNPAIPGLKVEIPKGAVLRTYDGKIVTKLSIVPVPVDRAPYLAPVPFSVYFTLQPGGAYVDGDPSKAIKIIYPNYQGLAAGSSVNFWNYDPGSGGWKVYGQGKVSADGKTIVPDQSVGFRQIMTFGYGIGAANNTAPAVAPPPGGCNVYTAAGDPVDCATGLFLHETTDLLVRDVIPISVTRIYRQNDNVSRAFGIGGNISYAMWLDPVGTGGTQVDLVLADGGRIHFTGSNDVWVNTDSPTIFHGAVLEQDTANHKWKLTLANQTVLRFMSDPPNNLVSITDRKGNALSITLSRSDITKVTSPNGRYITFSYDSDSRIYQATDNSGRTVSYTYDSSGRLASATDADGKIEQYGYDPTTNGMNAVTDKRGNVIVQNWFGANGRVIKQQLADGAVWQFSYTLDGGGNVTQTTVTDPRGYVRQDTFNPSGYLTQVILAKGMPEQETYTIDRGLDNLVDSVTDTLGRTTSFTYDAYGNVTSVTKLAGTSNAVTYDYQYDSTYHQLTSYTDPLSHTTTFGYDAYGNLTSVTDPLGDVTTLSDNGSGQPTRVTDPLGHTLQIGYAGGDPRSLTDALGRTTRIATDDLGRIVSVIDPSGNVSQFAYDATDRLVNVTDPLGQVTSASYDQNGNLLSAADPRNVVQSYAYDARNRVHEYTDPDGKTAIYQYDGMGNLISVVDRKNQTASFAYDGLNRLTEITYNDASTVSITWDGGNRPTKIVDSLNGTISRTYDLLDRLTDEATPQGEVSYGYDAAGRRTTMSVAGSTQVSYSYDAANRLTQIQQGQTSVQFGYDAANRMTSVTFPNGVVGAYAYDRANELTSISYDDGSTHIGDLGYTYDASGHRISMSGSLASLSLPPSITGATYDGANRLTNWGGTPLTYDANGNMTGMGSTTFSWDARNDLTGTSAGNATFVYDALGRRVGATIGGTATQYLYDGANPVLVGGGFELAGPGLDEYYARRDSAGVTSYLTDALGSVVALSGPNGANVATYAYSPYGLTTETGSDSSPFQFTGRENDGATGLYYYRARYYSPQMGRFISEDPTGIGAGTNFYAYANGDPIDYIDPLGLWALGDPLPPWVVDYSAGFGDTLSFGLTNYIRNQEGTNGVVDKCSGAYTAGQISGIGVATALGGAAGWEASGARAGEEGYEFSHWIPNRFGGPRSLWNGNYVSQEFHYLTDPFRFPSGWQNYGDKLPGALQQLLRVPWVYPGGAAGAAYGGASAATGSGCGCQQ